MALSSIGIRGADGTLAREKKFWEEYDPISRDLAKEIQQYEDTPRRKITGHQTEDEFYRLREANTESRKAYRFEKQDELKEQRTGRILHMNQFLLMLKAAGVKAWYTPRGAFKGMLGLYVNHNDVARYICFVQVPYMQEFEELYFDEYDVPLGPKRRGWRTVLLRLIEAGVLAEEKAHEVFGKPPANGTTRRYRENLHKLRNS